MVTSSGASRRVRAQSGGGGGGGHIVSCSVDGCAADLSKCREYHRRHKVCEAHSKTPIVVVGGREQRFCQQCSRFHSLSEFDQGKRSCRKRLDGHNRRRRKPQLDSLNPSSLLANHQGTRFSPHIRAPLPDPNWVDFSEKSKHETHRPHRFFPWQFPFLQQSEAATTTALGSDSAFSLLSSSSSAQSPDINLSPILYAAAGRIPARQTLQQCNGAGPIPCFHSSACTPMAGGVSFVQMEDENVGSDIMVSEANGTNLHCQGVFQVGGGGGGGGGSKLSFEETSETSSIQWQW